MCLIKIFLSDSNNIGSHNDAAKAIKVSYATQNPKTSIFITAKHIGSENLKIAIKTSEFVYK